MAIIIDNGLLWLEWCFLWVLGKFFNFKKPPKLLAKGFSWLEMMKVHLIDIESPSILVTLQLFSLLLIKII